MSSADFIRTNSHTPSISLCLRFSLALTRNCYAFSICLFPCNNQVKTTQHLHILRNERKQHKKKTTVHVYKYFMGVFFSLSLSRSHLSRALVSNVQILLLYSIHGILAYLKIIVNCDIAMKGIIWCDPTVKFTHTPERMQQQKYYGRAQKKCIFYLNAQTGNDTNGYGDTKKKNVYGERNEFIKFQCRIKYESTFRSKFTRAFTAWEHFHYTLKRYKFKWEALLLYIYICYNRRFCERR